MSAESIPTRVPLSEKSDVYQKRVLSNHILHKAEEKTSLTMEGNDPPDSHLGNPGHDIAGPE